MKRPMTLKRAALGLCMTAAVAAVVLPSIVPLLHAEDAPAAAAKADPKAEALMKKITDYYKSLPSASVTIDTHVAITGGPNGQNQNMDAVGTFAMERPNKLSIVDTKGQTKGSIVSDGKTLYTSFPQLNKYAEETAPASIDKIAEAPATNITAQHAGLVLALFVEDPYKKMTENVTASSHQGEKDLDGKKVEVLRLSQGDIDYDLYVDASDKPLVRKIVPDISRQLAKSAEQMPQIKGMKMDASIDMKDWSVGQPAAANQFAFTPPAGSTKVATAAEIFQQGGGGGADGAHALQGKPAPAISVDALDGGKFTLADHKDKVVIIDFWATWCGPCVRGLPIVTEVAKAYADKGVVFYAMNVQEDAATIKPFLEKQKLDIKVALDTDGAVSQAYAVQGIPQTVIIGKDGVVTKVHVGFGPDMKKTLEEDVKAALAGKAADPSGHAH